MLSEPAVAKCRLGDSVGERKAARWSRCCGVRLLRSSEGLSGKIECYNMTAQKFGQGDEIVSDVGRFVVLSLCAAHQQVNDVVRDVVVEGIVDLA